MIFRPAQLGMAKLDRLELEADKKACRKIGPCGVGKKALYLNSFYIDRRYYLPYGSISRVFKRVAMSSGGFTGKGMFASMAYLVVEYDGGKQKQCNFKDERDVDKLLEVLAKEQPQIPLLSEAGEQALQKKEAEKAARKLPELTDEAKHSVTVLRKGRYVGTVDTAATTQEELSRMMVGRPVQLVVEKDPARPAEPVLTVEHLRVPSRLYKHDAVKDVSFTARAGEIVCIAGIDGNGQTDLVYALTGLEKPSGGRITLCGHDITHAAIQDRSKAGMSHIPEDRHKHGLILDFTLEQNLVLQRFQEPQFQSHGFIRFDQTRKYAEKLIAQYDVRSGQGPVTIARSMSGGNQQKAIVAREIDRDKPLIVAVQPTRGLDVGAIEYIHGELVKQRDEGKAVLLVSLELDEVMNLSDRILVMYEGQIVGEFDPKQTTVEELGLYMAGAKRQEVAQA